MRYFRATTLFLVVSLIGCGGDVQPESGPVNSDTSTEEPTSPARPSTQAAPAETKTHEALAKDAVKRFLTATKSNDLDALTELTDVPFLLAGTVFNSEEELRPQLAQLLEKGELLSKLTYEIHDVVALETIAKEEMGGSVGDFVTQNLRDGDQIVSADLSLPDKKSDRHVHYVKIRNGNARVVGLLDVPIRD